MTIKKLYIEIGLYGAMKRKMLLFKKTAVPSQYSMSQIILTKDYI